MVKDWLKRAMVRLWLPFYTEGFESGLKAARKLPSEYLIMSRTLLEDYKRQAAKGERDRVVQLLLDHKYPKDAYVGSRLIDVDVLIKLIEEKK
jgi:hypothetical protein